MPQEQKKAVPADEKNIAVLELQSVIVKTMCNLIEYPNDMTMEHVERTQRYVSLLVEEMMHMGVYRDVLNSWDIEIFLQSVPLHDVGKIAIHDSILMKPVSLTVEEFTEMKKHTIIGEMIIEKMQQNIRETASLTESASFTGSAFLTHAKIIAGTHHEKWDGTGYPRGIAGVKIPLQGRLMAIADVYDALISDKPYKGAFSIDEAVQIIKAGNGVYFDPALADVFLAAARRFQG